LNLFDFYLITNFDRVRKRFHLFNFYPRHEVIITTSLIFPIPLTNLPDTGWLRILFRTVFQGGLWGVGSGSFLGIMTGKCPLPPQRDRQGQGASNSGKTFGDAFSSSSRTKIDLE
jgi:hypothetical protein